MADWSNVASASFRTLHWSNVAAASFTTGSGVIDLTVDNLSGSAALPSVAITPRTPVVVDGLSGAAVLHLVAITPRTPVVVDGLSGAAVLSTVLIQQYRVAKISVQVVTYPLVEPAPLVVVAALQSVTVAPRIAVAADDLLAIATSSTVPIQRYRAAKISVEVVPRPAVAPPPLVAVADMPGVQLAAVHFIPIFHNTPRLAKMAAVQVTVPLHTLLLVQSSTSTAVSPATTITPHIPIGIDALAAVATLGGTTQQPRFVVFNVDGDNKVNDEQQQVVIAVAAAGTEVGRVFWGGIEQPVYSWSDEEIIVTAAEAGLLPVGELYRWEVWKPNG